MDSELKLGRYRHYKGKEYKLIGIAKNSETLEEFAVYQALYGDHAIWIRPKAMFFERISLNGTEMPRFQYIGQ
ncbi:MAG: DUF1653 domain-containing protein [Patescibacteria group bacterium]|nr:DUF1653 domain-containing protein [Patescibacteria group bacterium]MDE1940863.1 DUF1653 domain-containing protein [Patescibacteria group bacterium]MDE1966456.1 DUF1653 domain-containing protein [Patescibacteria group bacterium]